MLQLLLGIWSLARVSPKQSHKIYMVYVSSIQHQLFYFPDLQFICIPLANIDIVMALQKVWIQSLMLSLPPWLASNWVHCTVYLFLSTWSILYLLALIPQAKCGYVEGLLVAQLGYCIRRDYCNGLVGWYLHEWSAYCLIFEFWHKPFVEG